MINPDSIPRYAEPTWDELNGDEMTPSELMVACVHCGACQTLLARLDMFPEDVRWDGTEVAEALGCADCDEWESS